MLLRANHSSSGEVQEGENRRSQRREEEIREANGQILPKSGEIFEPEHQETGLAAQRGTTCLIARD